MRNVTLSDKTVLQVGSLRYRTVRDMREKSLTPDTIHLNPQGADEALEIELAEVLGADRAQTLLNGEETLHGDLVKLHRAIWAETMGHEDEEKN